jgi:hypothetical protein
MLDDSLMKPETLQEYWSVARDKSPGKQEKALENTLLPGARALGTVAELDENIGGGGGAKFDFFFFWYFNQTFIFIL